MPMGFNDKVADSYIAHSVDLNRVAEGTKGEVLNLLYDLQGELTALVHNEDLAGNLNISDQAKRTENLIKETEGTIASAYDDVGSHVQDQLLEVADISAHQSTRLINGVFNSEVATTSLTRNTLEELVSNSMIAGAPAGAWWAKQAEDTQHRFATNIRMGMAQGETNDQLVKRIIGTPTGKKIPITNAKGKTKMVKEYSGGMMDVSKREATALVRTAVQTVNNNIQEKTFQENKDILGGRQLLVTLDARTSPICQGLSGGAWDFEGHPLPSSAVDVPFPGPPPLHFNCRSILIPITKSWNDLIKEAGGNPIDGLDEVSDSTQASMDGQVAGNLTYEQWLKTKPEAFQRDVLGATKYQLWKDGKLTLPEMLDQSNNPLTVAQMKQKVGMKATAPKTLAPLPNLEAEKKALEEAHKVELELATKNAAIAASNEAKATAQVEKAQLQRQFEAEKEALKTEIETNQTKAVDAEVARKKADSERVKAYKAKKKAEQAQELADAKARAETEAKLQAQQEAARIKAEADAQAARVKQAPPPFPPDITKLSVVKKLGGSTGAELVQDEWGQKFVRKMGASAEHLREEFQAEEGYRALGVNVPASKLYEGPNGPVKLSKFIDDGKLLSELSGAEKAKAFKDVSKNFVADALMGNTDVIGEGYDNVMMSQGVASRIDVGGSLRYRAMGALKDDTRWNGYVTEAFTMRDPKINRQTGDVFAGVSFENVVDQAKAILAKREQFLATFPNEIKPIMEKRLDDLAHMVKTAKTLTEDRYTWAYTENFARHQAQMGAAKLFEALPQQLTQVSGVGGTELVDEKGKPWDHLRGKDSVVKKFDTYAKGFGGTHEIVENWAGEQAGSSWSGQTQALKAFFADNRTAKPTEYYWRGSKADADKFLLGRQNKFGKEAYNQTMTAWHAYHTRFLEMVYLDNKDAAKGVIRLMRTEDAGVVALYKMSPGDVGLIERGLSESFSGYKSYTLFGSEVTLQEVPYHRVHGSYIHARSSGASAASGGMFAGNHENEFTALTEGIKATYLGSAKSPLVVKQAETWLVAPAKDTPAPMPRMGAVSAVPKASAAPVVDDVWGNKPKPLAGAVKKVAAGGNYDSLYDLGDAQQLNAALSKAELKPSIQAIKEFLGEPKLLDLNMAAFNKTTGAYEYGTKAHFATYQAFGGVIPDFENWSNIYFNGKIMKEPL